MSFDPQEIRKTKAVTPKGEAIWAFLNEPDDRFANDGQKAKYKINLAIPEDEAEALMKKLSALTDQTFEFYQNFTGKGAAKPAKKKTMEKYLSWEEQYNKETEEPTGNIEFKFSSGTGFEKNGKFISLKPKIFDSGNAAAGIKPKQIKHAINLGNGSIVQVSFSPNPFYNASTNQAGVSLRLNAVMIHELVEYGGGADNYGFDAGEGGFVAEESNGAPTDADASTDNMDPEDF